MTTSSHRPAELHLWWYAAVAVLAGAVIALVVATLHDHASSPAPTVQVPAASGLYSPYPQACFAGRHGGGIDLLTSGCARFHR